MRNCNPYMCVTLLQEQCLRCAEKSHLNQRVLIIIIIKLLLYWWNCGFCWSAEMDFHCLAGPRNLQICDQIWEKGPYGAKIFFWVINTIVFYDIWALKQAIKRVFT